MPHLARAGASAARGPAANRSVVAAPALDLAGAALNAAESGLLLIRHQRVVA